MTEAPSIDWKSATVEDGRLTVPFAGKPDAGWRERVEHVLGRLDGGGGGGWGAIEVGKRKLKVDAVSQGSESDLRHLLESAVLQANADLPADEEEGAEDDRSPADVEMTEAFRAFADG